MRKRLRRGRGRPEIVMSGQGSGVLREFVRLGAATLVFAHAAVNAQPGGNYVVPRTQYGQPDLQGIWSNAVVTPLQRPEEFGDKAFLTDEEAEEYERRQVAARNRDNRSADRGLDVRNAYNDFWWDSGENVVVTRRTSLIIDPPNGRIPERTPAALRRLAAEPDTRNPDTYMQHTGGPEDLDLMTRCIRINSAGPPMLPSAYNNNYQIVQNEDHVLIINEMVHETRVIPLDGRPPLPALMPQWLGTSRGRWEGDTLVVETTNFMEEATFYGSGPNMHLVERFTRVADNVLLYEFTVDDPESFAAPWTAQIPSVKTEGLMYEYACHEGNRGLERILRGARARERAEAEQGNSR